MEVPVGVATASLCNTSHDGPEAPVKSSSPACAPPAPRICEAIFPMLSIIPALKEATPRLPAVEDL